VKELLKYRKSMLEQFAQVTSEVESLLITLASQPDGSRLAGSSSTADAIYSLLAHLCQFEADTFLPRIERLSGVESSNLSGWPADFEPGAAEGQAGWLRVGETYTAIRRRELDLLHLADSETWSRQERHPAWGMRTLQWWAENSLAHGREHLRELREFLFPKSGERARPPA
jgi:hypothetical protein